jgi:hypothetical protein
MSTVITLIAMIGTWTLEQGWVKVAHLDGCLWLKDC